MNILQISTKVPFPPRDGGSAAVFAISSGLAALGNQVTILAVNPPKHYMHREDLKALPPGISVCTVDMDTSATLPGLLLNLFASVVPYHAARFKHRELTRKLTELLQSVDFQIIQIEGIYLGFLLPLIRKFTKAKAGFREHNIEHFLWTEITQRTKNPFMKLYLKLQTARLKRFEITMLRQADFVIPISGDDEKFLYRCGITNTHLMPFGLDPGKIHTIAACPPVLDLFYIGALDWIPNQDALAWFFSSVWPHIQDEFPGLVFHLAGRNAPEVFKENILQVPDVVFHGEIPDATAFMRSHRIMIVPLFSGSGLRIKILEALSLGVPVIASPKAVEGLPVGNGKHLFIAEDASGYVKCLKEMLENPSLLNTLAENGMKLVSEKFNNLVLSKELEHYYHSLHS